MKKMLSMLMVLVMLFTMLPAQALAAETGECTITVTSRAGNSGGPNGGSGVSVTNKYVIVNDTLYYINGQGTIVNTDLTPATFAAGTYTIYYGPYGTGMNGGKTVYTGTVTVGENDTTVNAVLSGVSYSTQSEADQYKYAESIYYNTSSFNHIHVRVEGSYVIEVNNKSYQATVSNPSMVVYVNGEKKIEHSWSGTETYEWTYSANVSRSANIEVQLTLDLTYRDANGGTVILEDVTVTYDNVNNLDKFIEAIAICDGVEGLDFTVSVEEIQEEIQYYSVAYEWKVYNTDGTYTSLPAGAPSEPATTSGHAAGSEYVYDTEYYDGASFYDYDNGLLYTFHGWDTYSHSSMFNVDPTAEGYTALDGNAITITADTYIYGYWTVSELDPASAHIAIEKVFIVDGVEMSMEDAGDLWFRIDTGIDLDDDGDTMIDVDYSMILAANGEYKISVYQYDIPFVFTEHNADVPGYTRSTSIAVTGDYIEGSAASGDSVTVTMTPVYQGENVHLGTVTYTNSYTKNIGTPVSQYPQLTLAKSATDTGVWQSGVVFTMYSDENCQTEVGTYTTTDGLAYVDFTGLAAGTYYLKETAAAYGYILDTNVYTITLTETRTEEQLRWNETAGRYEYVQVTDYALSVTVPEGANAVYSESRATDVYYRLHVYNEPILSSLNVTKAATGIDDADKSALGAVVIVHGPITRDSQGSITGYESTWTLTLDSDNSWSAGISELPVGEYLIHESFASVHGYTWTGVTYGDLETVVYNGITSGVFEVSSQTPIELAITNTYEEWTRADFYIKKVGASGNALAGAEFTLYADEACTQPATGTDITLSAVTGADGYAYFENFDEVDTYYLKETKAPGGYYLSDTVYKVEITTAGNAYTADIYEKNSEGAWVPASDWDTAHDLLIVENVPVLGELTITKAFTDGIVPESMTGVSVQVGGPNGYTRTVNLNNDNGWSVTLEGLALGDYTIAELNSDVPGYTWSVDYSSTTVSLTEENPGYTAAGAEISGAVTVTNTYTRNEETYEIPTTLTVRKVDGSGNALAGAVFTLDRLDAAGENVISSVSFTTGAEGIVVFDLLSGFIVDGDDVDGTYILSETKAPDGYQATDTTWKVTIKDDDGEIRVELNENKDIFENFWDWIVGNVDSGSWEDGVLTVENAKKVGSLTITKAVTDELELYADAEYAFTLDCSDDAFDKTFTLKAGEAYTVENIPWGTTYTLTEDTTGAAYTSAITDDGNGRIWADATQITVTNTYAYTTHNEPLALVKVDADDNTLVIAGAGFTLYADQTLETRVGSEVFSDENGCLALPIETAGTYYLAETTAPAGYHPNSNVYVVTAEEKAVVRNAGTADAVTEIQMHIRIEGLTGTTTNQIDYTYNIENTAIKTVVVNVEKIWDDGGYYARPEAVEVTLYRDNEPHETVTLNADNNWHYTWDDLTDEYDWSVDEAAIPAGYSKTVENEGNDWTITNTRIPNAVDITVAKAWEHNGGKDLPESINVTLYRNGEAYETVILSEENSWTHIWTGLTDASVWSVDETEVPAGYTREIAVDGYAFVITNTRTINPVEVSVTKVWVASEGVIHPESVEAVLYRDGEAYDTVTLSEENDWSYTWEDLTDEYTWSVDEKSVPAGYTKNVTSEGYDFTITNTRDFAYIDVSVEKVWYGADVTHPESVEVVLYRDGEAYDTVILSAENDWSYTWEDLTDEFQWTVDEPSVPSGYNKTVRSEGNSFTITNTYEDIPKTGDASNLFGLGTMAAVGAAGFGATLLSLIAPRKKEEDEQ